MSKISFANSNNGTITMAAVIEFPKGFDESRKYPTIVVSHPGGGVKEQASGLYAKKLAEQGLSPSPMTLPIRARARASPASSRTPMSAPKMSAP